jgi:hypothetical protein
MTKTKYWPLPDTGIKCPAITNRLKPCPIPGESKRNGFCHVHDPNGQQRQNHRNRTPSKKAIIAIAKEERLREEIAKDIEAQCPVSGTNIECNCDFHYAAQIARNK